MANLVVITGPLAVGKMTVAEALKEITGYNLMINHDSIEVSDKIFGFATPAQKEFNLLIREMAFNTAIKYNESIIFTMALHFDDKEKMNYLIELKDRFEKTGGNLYFIELFASLDTRIIRNTTPHRLEKKKSKRDLDWSRRNLINSHKNHKLNSDDGEYLFLNHMKINNENLSPQEVAQMIVNEYSFKTEFKEKKETDNKMY
ncbi:MAG: shikimate kinase [Eubacterium sp.]